MDGKTDENVTISEGEMQAYHWMVNKMNALATDIDKNFKEYRLSEALMSIYSFVWSDFCSWYLEMVKPNFGEKDIHKIT
jgi:valyl-tRNA synthetase